MNNENIKNNVEEIESCETFEDKEIEPQNLDIVEEVKGFVINELGNIVVTFGFLKKEENDKEIIFEIEKGSILGSAYKKDIPVIIGYSHDINVDLILDEKKTNIIKLGPDILKGEDDKFEFRITKDENLKDKKIYFVVRVEDINEDLNEELKSYIEEAKEKAKVVETDINNIEEGYNNYIKGLYVALKEAADSFNGNDIKVEEEYAE